jgi:putative tryptophan/tyrosine transport system substrate-binding protein
VKRREFITLLGGAAAVWPLAAGAQQPAMPVIGYLDSRAPDAITDYLRAFCQGLKETSHIEGENVAIEFRWAENQVDRLPELAADLARRRVAVIVAGASPAVIAAKTATATIPIVFFAPEDPVRLGLVTSLSRPGGNLTGVNVFVSELAAKRLELLRELVPTATRVAILLNPADAANAASNLRDVETAARAMGLQIDVFNADTNREIDTAFAALVRERVDALFVGSSPFFHARRVQLAHWATHQRIAATYSSRPFTEAGGLMSYGAKLTDAYRQMGVYAGSILKGAKPADLPVVQSSKFELIIDAQTARILGLTVPPTLLARADEVIE